MRRLSALSSPAKQVFLEAAELREHIGAHHRESAERCNAARRHPPGDVEHTVVDRSFGEALLQLTAHAGHLGMTREKRFRRLEPAVDDLAVSVDELHERETGRDGAQPSEPGIARSGTVERPAHVQVNHFDALGPSQLDGTVGRSGIDVDHAGCLAPDRLETAAQALAFVAAQDDDAEARRCRSVGSVGA
jgi:hypothetical protein